MRAHTAACGARCGGGWWPRQETPLRRGWRRSRSVRPAHRGDRDPATPRQPRRRARRARDGPAPSARPALAEDDDAARVGAVDAALVPHPSQAEVSAPAAADRRTRPEGTSVFTNRAGRRTKANPSRTLNAIWILLTVTSAGPIGPRRPRRLGTAPDPAVSRRRTAPGRTWGHAGRAPSTLTALHGYPYDRKAPPADRIWSPRSSPGRRACGVASWPREPW